MTAMPGDTPVRDRSANDPPATLELSDDETLVLSLYDKLRGIRLEKAILKTQLTLIGAGMLAGGLRSNIQTLM